MKKLSKLLLGILCVGTLTGCGGKEVERKGSIEEAVKGLENLTSMTMEVGMNMSIPAMDMEMEYELLVKTDKNGNTYTEMTLFEETMKSYTITKDGETCEIDYYTEDEIDEAGWYGYCYESVEEEEDIPEFDSSMLEGYSDEDFEYKDGWYVLNDEKTTEIKAAMTDTDLGEYASFVDFSSAENLKFKVQLADGVLETIKISFSVSEEGMKMNYELTLKLSKVNKTTVKAPSFKRMED